MHKKLTMNDFRMMIGQACLSRGFNHTSGVVTKIREAYGPAFMLALHRRGDRLLTPEGVDEYRTVEAWISAGCVAPLKPAHKITRLANKKRENPLYMRKADSAAARKAEEHAAPTATPRDMLKVAQDHVAAFGDAKAQLKHVQQSQMALYYRRALMGISENRATPEIIKQYIAEVLLVSQHELREMVSG